MFFKMLKAEKTFRGKIEVIIAGAISFVISSAIMLAPFILGSLAEAGLTALGL